MARWHPLLIGPQFEAPDKAEAEADAAKEYGANCLEVISYLDLEQTREERSAGNRRRKRKE